MLAGLTPPGGRPRPRSTTRTPPSRPRPTGWDGRCRLGDRACSRETPRVAGLGRGRRPLPDLRQLHDGLPDLLLHHHRGHHRPDRRARRPLAALGVVLRAGLLLPARRQRAGLGRQPVPAVDHPQAQHLARPVRRARAASAAGAASPGARSGSTSPTRSTPWRGCAPRPARRSVRTERGTGRRRWLRRAARPVPALDRLAPEQPGADRRHARGPSRSRGARSCSTQGEPAAGCWLIRRARSRSRTDVPGRGASGRPDAGRRRRARLVVARAAAPLALHARRRAPMSAPSSSTPSSCAHSPTPTPRSATRSRSVSSRSLVARLQSTRSRLLDLYGSPRAR